MLNRLPILVCWVEIDCFGMHFKEKTVFLQGYKHGTIKLSSNPDCLEIAIALSYKFVHVLRVSFEFVESHDQ